MKYLLKSLIFVMLLFFGLKLVFYILNDEHEVKYNIGNFKINEHYTLVDGKHSYFYEVENGDFEITFELNKNLRKTSKTIEDIKYYENEKCILPIFKNEKVIYDVMCKNENTVYYNYYLKNNLDLSNVKNYDRKKFEDNAKYQKYEVNKIYKENIPENHYLFAENYKGIVLINNEISTIKLFNNDIYTKEISTIVDKFYLVANYNEELTFKSFYLVNLINGKQREIRSVTPISFDSYIQGVVDDKVYLYDLDNKVQYEINLETELVTKIASNNNIKYYDGKWKTMTLKEALDKKTFNLYSSNKFNEYDKADKINDYYVYEKNGNYYNVYLINKENLKQRTFLFQTSDINSVTYFDEYIYFLKDNIYYNYSVNGIREIIENEEKAFNDTIKFGVYEK